MVNIFFLNLFKQKKKYNLIGSTKPIYHIFYIVLLLNLLFIMIPVIIKVPFVNSFVSWYLKDIGNMQGDFMTSIATILGTLLAVSGAIWAQRYFDSQKERKLIKVILSQLFTEFEDINDRAGECYNYINKVAKRDSIPAEALDNKEFRLSEHNDLKSLVQFNKSSWDKYKSDIILLFNDKEFIGKATYLYSILEMAGNYPFITLNNIKTIGDISLELYGTVTEYLESLKNARK